ncbi:phage holin family protein [Aquiflexum sp. LQ15W]|jgi:CHASE3 domain sensor protein|uniref:phage holin family protein n=1 Tax=Cognataquiflexum nitidum TaxID=2922272 RepID=UPI001F139695|nr:phage holin family protein [Cognataquiflexum nitidum]MCH6200116.1 phage holin family protein [Cognataquiflexum nitidum]
MLNVSEIIQTIKQLIEVRVQLVKDEVNEQISTVMARVFLLIVMGTVSVMVLFFASFSFAFYLSDLMRSPFKGFMYVALIYVLLLVLLYFLKDSRTLIKGFQEVIKAFVFKAKKRIDNEE